MNSDIDVDMHVDQARMSRYERYIIPIGKGPSESIAGIKYASVGALI
jgi:hypothetical protein